MTFLLLLRKYFNLALNEFDLKLRVVLSSGTFVFIIPNQKWQKLMYVTGIATQ